MPSSNIKIFDENKQNMKTDEEYTSDAQRLNGVQTGIASSSLQNKALYQVSLVAYAMAQVMEANGYDANDTDAVLTFVSNLSSSLVQKVADKASSTEVLTGTNNYKFVTPAGIASLLPLTVGKGGTGRNSLTSNAVLSGNGTSQVKMTATAKGAAYATAANGALTFGTLPVAEGGTGKTTLDSGKALIGAGTGAVTLRTIQNDGSLASGSSNLVNANAVVSYVDSQFKGRDPLAPVVGDVLFNRTTQTTDDLKRPFFYGGHIKSTPSDTGEVGSASILTFKNKYCAGKRIKLTWHVDTTVSNLHFYINKSALVTMIVTDFYGAGTTINEVRSGRVNLSYSDILSYGTSVTANQSKTTYFNIPTEYYPDSFVILNFVVAKNSSTNSSTYIDKIEIVD